MSHDRHAVGFGGPSGQEPGHLHAHQLPRRVILHIDLDCFYCQVEQKRLSIPADVPCAVQQWEGLIAVNYAARAAGITRHMRVKEAKKICPELQCVHVQTIGGDHTAAGGQAEGTAPPTAAAAAAAAAGDTATGHADAEPPAPDTHGVEGDVEGSAADRGSSKASLQRYRKASAEIMRLLAQGAPGCSFEKASIDEAYIDITQLASQELSQVECQDGGLSELLSRAAEASTVLGDGGLQADVDFDRLAAAGAVIAQRLRAAVAQQLSFTCSAGIGPNKLLAKIGSAKNKPNKQTVVLPRAIKGLMQDLPLGKVKGLGGKLGAKLESLGAPTAGAAVGLSWEVLVDAFGAKALWVWETVRGIDSEPVTAKSLVKSINSCKSFEPTSDAADVSRWLGVLAAELAERMAEDEADHARRARILVLQYRSSSVRNAPDRSIRGALPRCGREGYSTQSIAAAGQALFKRITPAPFPLVRLALAATEFADLPGHGNGGSSAALQRFLAAGTHQKQQQQEQQQEQQQHQQPELSLHQQQEPSSHEQQQQPQHSSIKPTAGVQQQHRKQVGPTKQPAGQLRLDQFARPQPMQQAPPSAVNKGQSELQQQQQQVSDKLHSPGHQPQLAASDAVHEQQQQQQTEGVDHLQQQDTAVQQHPQRHPGLHMLDQQARQQDAAEHSIQHLSQPDHEQALQQRGFDGPQAQQQQQPQPMAQEQPQQENGGQPAESLEQLAALAGADLASQARILRDIEIQGMMKSRQQQQAQQVGRGAGGASSQPAQKKRKGAQGQQGQQGGKQMRISNLFGGKQ